MGLVCPPFNSSVTGLADMAPVEKIRGGGEQMKYHWTNYSRFMHYTPWKFWWNHDRSFRYLVIAVPISMYIVGKAINTLSTPDNIKKWDDLLGRNNNHTLFDLPTEDGHH